MATVPSQHTWTVGEFVTAASMNDDVRDAINFLLNPPYAKVSRTAAQSITNATLTAISFDTEVVDTDGAWAASPNPTRVTPATPGWYDCVFGGGFATNATGYRYFEFRRNGTDLSAAQEVHAGVTAAGAGVTKDRLYANGTTDYFEAMVFQNSGGALNTDTGARAIPVFSAMWSSN